MAGGRDIPELRVAILAAIEAELRSGDGDQIVNALAGLAEAVGFAIVLTAQASPEHSQELINTTARVIVTYVRRMLDVVKPAEFQS